MAFEKHQNSLLVITALRTRHRSIGTTLKMPKVYSNIQTTN